VKVWVTVVPVETFSMTAVPAVLLVAVTVTLVVGMLVLFFLIILHSGAVFPYLMVFPAAMVMPEKS
jgi:hypothetical protein